MRLLLLAAVGAATVALAASRKTVREVDTDAARAEQMTATRVDARDGGSAYVVEVYRSAPRITTLPDGGRTLDREMLAPQRCTLSVPGPCK